MISRFFTKTFNVYRQEWSNESSAEITKSSFLGHIQPTGSEEAQVQIGIALSKPYKIWCPVNTNIMVGDRIVDTDSKIYNVEYIKKWDIGNNQHLEILIDLDISEPISV